MHALDHKVNRRLELWVIFENSEAFLRPEDLSARDIPAEAARVAQLLRLGEVGFMSSTQGILRALAFRDVVISLQCPDGMPVVVALERPPTFDGDLRPVARRVQELALPAPDALQRLHDLLKRNGKDRLQKR